MEMIKNSDFDGLFKEASEEQIKAFMNIILKDLETFCEIKSGNNIARTKISETA
jgi:predicted amidohydrolase